MAEESNTKAIRTLRWGLVAVSFWLFLGVVIRFFVKSKPMPSHQWIATGILFAALPLVFCTQLQNKKRSTWFLGVLLLLFLIIAPRNLFSIHAIVSVGCLIALVTRGVREHFNMTRKQ